MYPRGASFELVSHTPERISSPAVPAGTTLHGILAEEW